MNDSARPPPSTRKPEFDVPTELLGREVSVRALGPAWQAVRAKHLDPTEFARATGYGLDVLRNPRERISWAGFARFLTNLGTNLDDDELIALVDAAMSSPALRLLMLPGRLLFSIPELYLWAWGPRGPASQMIVNYQGEMRQLDAGRLRFETHMTPGYAPSRENYLLLEGSLRGLSRAAGAGPSDVVHTELPDGALYQVTVPKTGGALGVLRRRLNWLVAARSTATALRQANEELLDRYVELQRESDARAEASDRLADIVDASVDGIVGTTVDGVVTDWNAAAERIYGWTADEVRGHHVTEIVPADRRAEIVDLLERLRQGERITQFDTERVRKDGKRIRVSLGLAPIRDRTGAIVGFSTLVRDTTDAVEAERQRAELEAQLLRAQRLESIGRLAGGIAHDFNNVLTAIMGFARLTAESLPGSDPNQRNIEAIETAASSAAKLVRQLLAFSRQQVIRPEIVDLGALVQRITPMLQRLIGEDVETAITIGSELWSVECDPGQIEQVVVNLAVNARDAMPEGGRLTIDVSNRDLDAEYAREHAVVRPGPYVMLAVSDTGLGMDEETQSHVFEPFFTTKEPTQGTGLGLATVYGIVKQSGGFIWIYSEPGLGTTVRVYLPRVAGPASSTTNEPDRAPAVGGGETVLVVEDDPMLRDLLQAMLARLGYAVIVTEDAASAMDAIRTRAVDVVLTDVVMPGSNGPELAIAVRQDAPGLPILFMSGYSGTTIQNRINTFEATELLEKPFTFETLDSAIRRALARSRS